MHPCNNKVNQCDQVRIAITISTSQRSYVRGVHLKRNLLLKMLVAGIMIDTQVSVVLSIFIAIQVHNVENQIYLNRNLLNLD